MGICFDTCHAFASGYNLSTSTDVKKVFREIDCLFGGLDVLRCIHLNDSKGSLNCHVDRHENITYGHIWGREKSGLSELIHIAKRNHIPLILETPLEITHKREEIELVKSFEDKNEINIGV